MAAVVVELEKDGDHNDGARSIRTIVPYELEREDEEDEDQLVEQEEQQAERQQAERQERLDEE